MEISDMKRLKELEGENSRLKHLVAEQALDILALKEVLGKSIKPVAEEGVSFPRIALCKPTQGM